MIWLGLQGLVSLHIVMNPVLDVDLMTHTMSTRCSKHTIPTKTSTTNNTHHNRRSHNRTQANNINQSLHSLTIPMLCKGVLFFFLESVYSPSYLAIRHKVHKDMLLCLHSKKGVRVVYVRGPCLVMADCGPA